MDRFKSFETQLYTLNDGDFENIAVSLFRFQAKENPLYGSYMRYLGVNPELVTQVNDIPFFPVSIFKDHEVKTGTWTPEACFVSSGTTGKPSRHLVRSVDFYLRRAQYSFEFFFGPLSGYHILALLPSYHNQPQSSLLAMIDHFIRISGSNLSGFYLDDLPKLIVDVEKLRNSDRKVVLWGVTYALLDLAEQYGPDLSDCIIVETGGMKGRRSEITRAELHMTLKKSLKVGKIFSEYGMTELMSQAYTRGGEGFYCPPGMRILVREITDPFQKGIRGVGGLNVVDLGNFHSISFIELEDLGQINNDGSFSVVGRMDNSDIRGCNLLIG